MLQSSLDDDNPVKHDNDDVIISLIMLTARTELSIALPVSCSSAAEATQ